MLKNLIRVFIYVSVALTLSACAISQPFDRTEAFEALPEGQKVVVGVTHVVLKEGEDSDIFWQHIKLVRKSLETQPGLLGHSLRAELFGNEAWTMSVWESEDALREFVSGDVHLEAISEGMDPVEAASFHTFTTVAGNAPPSWEAVLKLLNENGRSYSY